MHFAFCCLLALSSVACISPSVVETGDRATKLTADQLEWNEPNELDVPGTYVSIEITGQLAAVLRKVVYLFEGDGTYTGAGLVDGAPPHFEVISGTWQLQGSELYLDDAPPASLQVAGDGTLRFSGAEGSVTLRREQAR